MGPSGLSSLLLGTKPNPRVSHLAGKKERGKQYNVFLEEE